MQFTYAAENNNLPPFINALVIHKNHSIETTVYRKLTKNDAYLNWNSFSPKYWKRGTLRTTITRSCIICSIADLLQKELDHISFVLLNYNKFPKRVIDQVLHPEKENHRVRNVQPEINDASDEKSHLLVCHMLDKKEKS